MLRHLNREVIRVDSKSGSTLNLENGTSLFDLSGGSLTQNITSPSFLNQFQSKALSYIVPSSGFESEQKSKLHETIMSLCNGQYEDMLWASSGSDAIESALWAANVFSKSKYGENIQNFIVRKGSYHGNTELCRKLSTRNPSGCNDSGVLIIDECKTTDYHPCDEGDSDNNFLASLRQLIDRNEVIFPALVILEGKPTTGWRFNSDGQYLQEIISFCKKNKILVILDDVASGSFRHGFFTSCKNNELAPDITVVSKGLTSGYHPLSCTLLSMDIVEVIKNVGGPPITFTHGLTEFSAVIANKCLDFYKDYFNSEVSLNRKLMIDEIKNESLKNLTNKGVGISATPTTIRLDMSVEQARKFSSELKSYDMWAYIGSSVMKTGIDYKEERKYAHICTAFDLSARIQNRIRESLLKILTNL